MDGQQQHRPFRSNSIDCIWLRCVLFSMNYIDDWWSKSFMMMSNTCVCVLTVFLVQGKIGCRCADWNGPNSFHPSDDNDDISIAPGTIFFPVWYIVFIIFFFCNEISYMLLPMFDVHRLVRYCSSNGPNNEHTHRDCILYIILCIFFVYTDLPIFIHSITLRNVLYGTEIFFFFFFFFTLTYELFIS